MEHGHSWNYNTLLVKVKKLKWLKDINLQFTKEYNVFDEYVHSLSEQKDKKAR